MNGQQKLIIPRNDLPIKRSYLVEVPLDNVGVNAKPEFQRDNVLNPNSTGSVIFTGCETYTSTYLLKSPSGRDVVTDAEAKLLVVSFIWEDDEFIRQMPYTDFISFSNYGMVRRLSDVKIELTKSYLTVFGAGIGAGKSAMFNFFYRDSATKVPRKK